MLVSLKFFPQFVEKIEKPKLILSKQRYKMLKIRSEMLKIRKNGKIIKLGRISRKFPEYREFFFENFPFPGKLKVREKGKLKLSDKYISLLAATV